MNHNSTNYDSFLSDIQLGYRWAIEELNNLTDSNHPHYQAEHEDAQFSDEAEESMDKLCADFYSENIELINEAQMDPRDVGYNLYLSAAQSGSGFCDRGLGELGDKLTRAAEKMPSFDVYVSYTGDIEVS